MSACAAPSKLDNHLLVPSCLSPGLLIKLINGVFGDCWLLYKLKLREYLAHHGTLRDTK